VRNKLFLITLALLLAISLVAIGCPATQTTTPPTTPQQTTSPPTTPPPSEEVFHWRIQGPGPESDAAMFISLASLEQIIEESSEGRVQVDVYCDGVLCARPETVDAVKHGAIEAASWMGAYGVTAAPSALLTEIPFGASDVYEDIALHQDWGLTEVMREEYAPTGIYLLSNQYAGDIAFHSTFPVNTADDLNGKLVWVIPTFSWMTDFGAVPTEVPGFDVYTAMKLGTIEGHTWPLPGLREYNMVETSKYVMIPALCSANLHVGVNMDAWNALGPDLQQKIQSRVDADWPAAWIQVYDREQEIVQEAKDAGVQFITLPPAELDRMKAAAKSYWDQVAAMSPACAEGVEIYKNYMASIGKPIP
jgi:TRAP-type C4-dicarboxylate transport system substrate-binding protein